jgi:hypothetical protein
MCPAFGLRDEFALQLLDRLALREKSFSEVGEL